MNAIYFLIFIGICIFIVVLAARNSKAKSDLARKSKTNSKRRSNPKLATPPDHALAHHERVWKRHQQHASASASERPDFVPKSKNHQAPSYDGFSRRDRHQVAPKGAVKDKGEGHIEDQHGLTMTSTRSNH